MFATETKTHTLNEYTRNGAQSDGAQSKTTLPHIHIQIQRCESPTSQFVEVAYECKTKIQLTKIFRIVFFMSARVVGFIIIILNFQNGLFRVFVLLVVDFNVFAWSKAVLFLKPNFFFEIRWQTVWSID